MTQKEIIAEVKKLDPNLSESDSSFKTARLMLTAATEGVFNADVLAGLVGLPRSFVRKRIKNLRDNGVFKDGKVYCEWFDKNGGIAFWMDVCVAEGWMGRK
jgi:hypothetical protein